MSWFSKLWGSNTKSDGADSIKAYPDIPEDVFIEKTSPNEKSSAAGENESPQDNIHKVYDFLSKDYQQAGYDDALVHPDTSFKNEKVREIQGELDITIRKSK